jgi:thymidine kinase
VKGKIELFCGSMKTGKTTALYTQIDLAKYRQKSVVLIRPMIDTRKFTSRTTTGENQVTTIFCNTLREIEKKLTEDIICIDEGQFIEDIGEISNNLANKGKEVYIAALLGDSDQKPWGPLTALLPYVDDIIKLNAVCEDCGSNTKATFTYFDGKKDGQIVIGDQKYLALCRECINTRKANLSQ